MKTKLLGSGSRGNTAIVLGKSANLIIDIGLSYLSVKRMLEEDDLSFEDFNGMLITHSHNDHIKGLSTFLKHTKMNIYIPEEMYHELAHILPKERCVFVGDQFQIEEIEIELIHTSHDTNFSVGFIIKEQEKSLVYITDTGYINRKFLAKIKNKDIYIIESNHDEVMLMDGPYPRFLKERVISDKGHLSNKTTARYLKQTVGENTKYIVLAHLSEKNNTEELAYQETKKALDNNNIQILIARQEEPTKLLEV